MRKICLSAVQTNLNLNAVFFAVVVDQTVETVKCLLHLLGCFLVGEMLKVKFARQTFSVVLPYNIGLAEYTVVF